MPTDSLEHIPGTPHPLSAKRHRHRTLYPSQKHCCACASAPQKVQATLGAAWLEILGHTTDELMQMMPNGARRTAS